MKTFLLLTSVFLSIALNAQSSSFTNSKTDSIYYKNPFFSMRPVIMKGERKLTKNETASLFSRVPKAEIFYEKYKRNYKIGFYCMGAFFAGAIISSLSLDNGNRTFLAIGLPLSVYSFIGEITFFSIGDYELRKAIKSYNKSVIKY
jgi:hypothetical protein